MTSSTFNLCLVGNVSGSSKLTHELPAFLKCVEGEI